MASSVLAHGWWEDHPDNDYFVGRGFEPRAGVGVWIKEVDGVGVFRVQASSSSSWCFWFRSWSQGSIQELEAYGCGPTVFEPIIEALGGA